MVSKASRPIACIFEQLKKNISQRFVSPLITILQKLALRKQDRKAVVILGCTVSICTLLCFNLHVDPEVLILIDSLVFHCHQSVLRFELSRED